MDRHLDKVFFRWLPIGRCDFHHGSRMSQPRPARTGRASGNIEAVKLLMPLWFFRRSGAYQKKIPAATLEGEGYCPFARAIPPLPPARYTSETNFI
jgi:hypothetical protein